MEAALFLDQAQLLPQSIKLGTSSWIYPGWQGLVYSDAYKNPADFKSRALEEYQRFPWFRAVGIDHTFYKPIRREQLELYEGLTPQNFVWLCKVWERITIPHFPAHSRYGQLAGNPNSDFLNNALFEKEVLKAYDHPKIKRKTGPFIFQFPCLAPKLISSEQFLDRLNTFLQRLPQHYLYCIEIRNKELLCPEYFKLLNCHKITHCFNHWCYMPELNCQMKAAAEAGGLSAQHFVARLLTPLNLPYQKAVELFKPYDKLKQVNQTMRQDAVRLAKRAINRSGTAYILINNRAEGCAPLTVAAIGSEIVRQTGN